MTDDSSPNPRGGSPRRTPPIPFLVLAGVVVAVTILFYQVIRPLALPLFLAAVIALLAHPLHARLTDRLGGRASLSAGIITLLILLVLVGPLGTAVGMAVSELRSVVEHFREGLAAGEDWRVLVAQDLDPRLADAIGRVERLIPLDADELREKALTIGAEGGEVLYRRSLGLLGSLPGLVLGLVMFLIALFFFLRDGSQMILGWEELTPMNAEHDRLIRGEFARVCRGVVLGTLAAAVAQGVLLGLGLFAIDLIAGTGIGRWTFLLSLLTVAFSMVPFLGAAAIWAPTALLMFSEGHPAAAVVLAVYGAVVVSLSDNLVKVLVIGETAGMHPLLVFVSVFGGIQLVGFLGIFVGPIVAAVLFTLLRILRREIVSLNRPASGRGLDRPEAG
ncbi:AI-2E family transporter [Tautonia plasticadhaerens]|uniref:Putative inner membrane protein n=1 Tax=Tautonia plasticadhaerens TaxID=2527974 RepID=A0A518GVL5_9BACT|nr:AI-2E family transporter [Tautonia plasticadhaerens]QDV32599.1 putative inner membrane protein [Tautonia plasticadhaerens]